MTEIEVDAGTCENCGAEPAIVRTRDGKLGEACLNLAIAQGYDPETDPDMADIT